MIGEAGVRRATPSHGTTKVVGFKLRQTQRFTYPTTMEKRKRLLTDVTVVLQSIDKEH